LIGFINLLFVFSSLLAQKDQCDDTQTRSSAAEGWWIVVRMILFYFDWDFIDLLFVFSFLLAQKARCDTQAIWTDSGGGENDFVLF